MSEQQTELLQKIALARKKLRLQEILHAYDPTDLTSRPTPEQDRAFRELATYSTQDVRGGNQCLVKGTLVMTPKGPVAIEDIQPGDLVYDEFGQQIRVKATFANGPKPVADITFRGKVWASCTPDHVWQVETGKRTTKEKTARDFRRDDGIRRVAVSAPLGSVSVPGAYALGALLGDGCSRQSGPRIQISSGTSHVPDKVASVLGGAALRLHESNYTWSVGLSDLPYYADWCKGRYAHEKTVDLDVLKTWDRESLLQFVAGIIDTDGSVYPAKDHVSIAISMQAAPVIAAIRYAFLALWQVPLSSHVDQRSKYVNGPVFNVYTRNAVFVRQILKELDPYLVSPQKKWRPEYETLGGRRTRNTCISAEYGRNARIEETYDIHVDSPTNLYLLANGLVTHNSGKSMYGARNIAYFCNRKHPYVDIDELWPTSPILCLVLAKTSTHYEEHWEKKIKPFFEPGTFKETKVGGVLKTVRFKNGSKIIFFSYENPYAAAERVQSFTGHLIWIDEICDYLPLYEESERRLQKFGGRLIITYTAKKPVPKVRKYIEAPSPYKQSYAFDAFDNPSYSDEAKRKIEASINQLPPSERAKWYATIRYGAWMESEESVYNYDSDLHSALLPDHYDPRIWRHHETADPAASGKCGLIITAEDPQYGHWYIVKAIYLPGEAPSELLDAVERETAGYNITHRTADPNAAWFIKEAAKRKRYYGSVLKDGRKEELIKGVSTAFRSGWLKVVEDSCDFLLEELGTAKWSEKNPGRIVNSTRYHLLDCLQYFVDTKPKFSPVNTNPTPLVLLALANRKRKAKEKAAAKRKNSRLRPAFRLRR